MTEPRIMIDCAHCHRRRTHSGRGLCGSCRQGNNGCNPTDYERLTWPSTDLLTEYEFLRRQGYTRRAAAERLGITKARLDKAIERQSRQLQVAS